MKEENPIIKKKSYKIEIEIMKNGASKMSRTNDGFNAYELLGILSLASMEIKEQIAGKYKPDIKVIKRK